MPAETHTQGDPMSRDEILTLIKERLADLEAEVRTLQKEKASIDQLDYRLHKLDVDRE